MYSGLLKDLLLATETTDLLVVLLTSGSVFLSSCAARLERVITPAGAVSCGVDEGDGVAEGAEDEWILLLTAEAWPVATFSPLVTLPRVDPEVER